MKAVTLTPPYGTLVALAARLPHLGKHIETRTRALPQRFLGHPLAIHQAKGLPKGVDESWLADVCASEPFRTALGITTPDQLPRGRIVAVVTPVASYPSGAIYARDDDESPLEYRVGYYGPPGFVQVLEPELSFGNYGPRRHAWLLEQIVALHDPIEARGALGLWDVPPGAEAAIREQLRRLVDHSCYSGMS